MANSQEIIFPYGEFKGVPVIDVPSDYLEWVVEQKQFIYWYEDYIPAIKLELKHRDIFNLHFYERKET